MGKERVREPDELFFDESACGCLLGLAVGDALGAPVEFSNRAAILDRYGPDGIRVFVPHNGLPAGSWTDDTQLAVATARGILDWRGAPGWAEQAGTPADLDDLTQAIWRRYLEWLDSPECPQGSPGGTTLAALRAGRPLTLADPVNPRGKGCGGVMRVAPLGLVGLGEAAFEAGARAATLTHRHPTSDAASGFLVQLIDDLMSEGGLAEAVDHAREVLVTWPGHRSTLDVVDTAVRLAAEGGEPYEAIGRIGHVGKEDPHGGGKGWVAEEALGIALFCALRFPEDFAAGVHAAVNISGDSDSTGAITGAILGTANGLTAVPLEWRERVAGRETLLELGQALCGVHDEQNVVIETADRDGPARFVLSPHAIDEFIAWLPLLERVEAAVGDWRAVAEDEDYRLVSRIATADLERCRDIMTDIYLAGWIAVFGWPAWNLGRYLYDHPSEIARADLTTLRRLYTMIARANRAVDGAFETALVRGVFAEIARRLAFLRDASNLQGELR